MIYTELTSREARVLDMVRIGATQTAIAHVFGVTRQAVARWLRSPRLRAALAGAPLPPLPRRGRPPRKALPGETLGAK